MSSRWIKGFSKTVVISFALGLFLPLTALTVPGQPGVTECRTDTVVTGLEAVIAELEAREQTGSHRLAELVPPLPHLITQAPGAPPVAPEIVDRESRTSFQFLPVQHFEPVSILLPPHQTQTPEVTIPVSALSQTVPPHVVSIYQAGALPTESEYQASLATPEFRNPERVVAYDFTNDPIVRARPTSLTRRTLERIRNALPGRRAMTNNLEIHLPPTSLGIDGIDFRHASTLDRLKDAVPLLQITRFLARGGQSEVYLGNLPSLGQRVYKVLMPIGASCPTTASCVKGLLRAITLMPLLQSVANAARFEGQRFVEVVPLDYTPEMLRQGVVSQAFSQGPTVESVANLIRTWRNTPASFGKNAIARQLQEYGITDIANFERRMQTLGQMYGDLHGPTLRISHQNGIPTLGTYLYIPDGRRVIPEVGMDFNRGQNIIWNVERRMFQIIDW